MSVISNLLQMIEFMEKGGIKDQFERYIINEEEFSMEFFKFSFYNFESFYSFITQDFNFYVSCKSSYTYLHAWYSSGYCSPLILYPDWLKHKGIFRTVECINNCIMVDDNEHEYEIEFEDDMPLRLNSFGRKIVVWFHIYEEEDDRYELSVAIRMPVICKECILHTNKSTFHSELLINRNKREKNIRLNYIKAIRNIEKYKLCEPMLKKHILNYLP